MRSPIEQPITTEEPGPGGMGQSVTRHPAFAQIGASRVSGRTNLFASDFSHNAYMTISIRRCQLNRNLSNDWHFGREELIEVSLSEAQWATFVSSPNVGSGVPCTLQHLKGEVVAQLPDPTPRAHQFGAEVRKSAADSLIALDELAERIGSMGLSGVKTKELQELVRQARSKLSSTIPFVAEQFDEHAEKTIEHAKSEVHGYMTGVILRSGIAALKDMPPPLQIEEQRKDD